MVASELDRPILPYPVVPLLSTMLPFTFSLLSRCELVWVPQCLLRIMGSLQQAPLGPDPRLHGEPLQ